MLKYILPVSEVMFGGGPIQDTREVVNSLIAESFGPNFRGDYRSRKENSCERGILNPQIKTGYMLERGDSLGVIAAENSFLDRVLSFGMVGKFEGYAGVLNEDGSEITVPEGVESIAQRYSNLYEMRFNVEAKVNVVSPEELEDLVYPVLVPFS